MVGHGRITPEALRARVVHIYKEGNTSDLANYRPISLLNAMYKIMASIVQKRVSEGIDKYMLKAQYGFRKARSTRHAIHQIRKILEIGEGTTSRLIMVLLDWEKAFDKLTKEGLLSALSRANIPVKIINIITAMYEEPTFMVEIDGVNSNWKIQETGIRQGCPLSPYLFIIYMTVMIANVKEKMGGNRIQHRIAGATFDEVLFADDTICLTKDTRTMNTMLAAIEEIGGWSGMKLSKGKCEALLFGTQPKIKFQNQTLVKKVAQAKYLGCMLNNTNDTTKEVRARIRDATVTMKRMHSFWSHSNCTTKFKLNMLKAVLFTKVLFGMESA